ncbi:glutamate carboxypeptidase [Brevibacterium siliguriense]|uniref:Glutamate carboxypeptidase n=1 Tax=Brevibacterium siliguriense TaxID=1136497 RepID=A0A1H1Y442_9MICO|nr:M20/M25/M40 family metallo-hydrolase [Brevibacterium siliguriense]SDT16162.1 glutamate carboxypeptidase [Brevibacterium siliguriense]
MPRPHRRLGNRGAERGRGPCSSRRDSDERGIRPSVLGGPEPGGILILGHADTVWPVGTLAEIPFAVAEDRATGPGVFDMKSGIVSALEALTALQDTADLSLLITGDEETGSVTSRGLIEEAARAHRAVLILEPSLGGALKIARRGVGIYRVEITGVAAHAGLDPAKGINALRELAHVIQTVSRAASTEADTHVTPSVASGGTAVNTVPAEASLKVDVRAWSLAELERVDAVFGALAPLHPGAGIAVHGGINRPPMPVESSVVLCRLAQQSAERLGQPELDAVEVGGGSDGNFTAAAGTATLDGLGPIGDGAHARHEWVRLSSMVERAELTAELIRSIRSVDGDSLTIASNEKRERAPRRKETERANGENQESIS